MHQETKDFIQNYTKSLRAMYTFIKDKRKTFLEQGNDEACKDLLTEMELLLDLFTELDFSLYIDEHPEIYDKEWVASNPEIEDDGS